MPTTAIRPDGGAAKSSKCHTHLARSPVPVCAVVVFACDSWFGTGGPKDGYGGVLYRCEMVYDEMQDATQDTVQSVGTPAYNRCINPMTPYTFPIATYPIGDPRGNTIDANITLPFCSTYLVDACMPRKFYGVNETTPVNLEDALDAASFDNIENGDITGIPNDLFVKGKVPHLIDGYNVEAAVQEYCRYTVFIQRLLDRNPGVTADNPLILTTAHNNTNMYRRYSRSTVIPSASFRVRSR